MSLDKKRWSRQTYSLLDWLGDLGGLYDALRVICGAIIAPVSNFVLEMTLLTTFFYSESPNTPQKPTIISY